MFVCVCTLYYVYKIQGVEKFGADEEKLSGMALFVATFTFYMSNKMNYSENGNELTYCV